MQTTESYTINEEVFIENIKKLAASTYEGDVKLAMALLGQRGRKWCTQHVSDIFRLNERIGEKLFFTYKFKDFYISVGAHYITFFNTMERMESEWVTRHIEEFYL